MVRWRNVFTKHIAGGKAGKAAPRSKSISGDHRRDPSAVPAETPPQRIMSMTEQNVETGTPHCMCTVPGRSACPCQIASVRAVLSKSASRVFGSCTSKY